MSIPAPLLRGRLAPSPTGALHVGNVCTFLVAWLAVRAQGGKVILRVEDLEKTASGVILEEMLSDLAWLGLDWDEGPQWTPEYEQELIEYRRYPKVRLAAERRHAELAAQKGIIAWPSRLGHLIESIGDNAPYIQSRRGDLYEAIFERLRDQGLIYPCVCSRSDYAASAPHAGDTEARYPGTCRERWEDQQEAHNWLHQENIESIAQGREVKLEEPVWRFKVSEGEVTFFDGVQGNQKINVEKSIGDFVAFKSPRQPSYQLAVVADDIAMEINQVVRGNDLIPSTARQILLYQALGRSLPEWVHTPLVIGPDGKRVAKRHGDSRIRHLRDHGVSPLHIIGSLAQWLGIGKGTACSPAELITSFKVSSIPRQNLILDPAKLGGLLAPDL